MYKEIIKPALILFLICVVMTGTLAYVNGITKPIIDENNRLAEQESLMLVIDGVDSFSDGIDDDNLREKGFDVTDRIEKLYEAQKDGKLVGYVVAVSSRGYKGDISILVGVDIDQTISGVTLTSHNETPGLGANVAYPEFTDQFKGEIPQNSFFVVHRQASDENEIQAVTSATVSSRAVTDAVADAVTLIRSVLGGE